jgi:group I intron endonuclease
MQGTKEGETRHEIYRIRCLVSGKAYIGQTRRTALERFRQHCGEARRGRKTGCSALYDAIRAYGKTAFEVSVLEVLWGQEAANQRERELIAGLGTLCPGGYNLHIGGRVDEISQATRIKISKALTGKPSPMRGVPRPQEVTDKVFASRIKSGKRWGRPKGYVCSPETLEKMSSIRKGIPLSPERRAKVVAAIRARAADKKNRS